MIHQRRWLQVLRSLGLEFWLPLPLLGLCFWVGGGLLTDQILSRFYSSADHLRTDRKLEVQRLKTVQAIEAKINKSQGFSKIRVKTTNSPLRELHYEFPVTSVSRVEAAISQELGLSSEDVRKTIRYQIVD